MRDCGIARDLLPLYQEGMLSADSVEFLEEHLRTCPACRAEREKLAAGPVPPEEKTEKAPELERVRRKLRPPRRRPALRAGGQGRGRGPPPPASGGGRRSWRSAWLWRWPQPCLPA